MTRASQFSLAFEATLSVQGVSDPTTALESAEAADSDQGVWLPITALMLRWMLAHTASKEQTEHSSMMQKLLI